MRKKTPVGARPMMGTSESDSSHNDVDLLFQATDGESSGYVQVAVFPKKAVQALSDEGSEYITDRVRKYKKGKARQIIPNRRRTTRNESASVDLDCPRYSDVTAQNMASGSDDAGHPNYSRCPSYSNLSSNSSD